MSAVAIVRMGLAELEDATTDVLNSALGLLDTIARGTLIASGIAIAFGIILLASGSSRALGTLLSGICGLAICAVALSGGTDWMIDSAQTTAVATSTDGSTAP
ncbi:hypothetical protein [Rhodococcus sp. NBC_00297]|uniref:hypothetical protein n=1 Tax=Rhodococcus sp. NBC_00297 TaxID=2976005 RepID=UPI002E287C24|nr:hypothetical protein [Rhodococcus sp. NBC_00297]